MSPLPFKVKQFVRISFMLDSVGRILMNRCMSPRTSQAEELAYATNPRIPAKRKNRNAKRNVMHQLQLEKSGFRGGILGSEYDLRLDLNTPKNTVIMTIIEGTPIDEIITIEAVFIYERISSNIS